MPLLVDTFNVLHITGVLPPDLAGLDIAGLADLISISRYARDRVTLVCDGTPSRRRNDAHGPGKGVSRLDASLPSDTAQRSDATGRRGAVVVRYSGVGVEADDLIGRMIDRSSSPRSLLVISTDRRVRAMAARRRCAWLTAERFLAQLVDDHRHGHQNAGVGVPEPLTPLSPSDVTRWARELGLDPDDLERPAEELVGLPPPTRRSPNAGARPTREQDAREPRTPTPPARATRPQPAPSPSSSNSPRQSPPQSPGQSPGQPPGQPPGPPPPPLASRQPPSGDRSRYRPLDEAERPEEIDPSELERFDLDRWMREHHLGGDAPTDR